jgi:4-carboxymuconolactone decarboxylase
MREGACLGLDREALLEVSAAIAVRKTAMLERALLLAKRFSPPDAVDEILLQSHLFVGFPLALEALMVWRRIAPRSAPPPAEASVTNWKARGEVVCRNVYGANYEKLRENVSALDPDLDRWMVEDGYGKVIGRPELDLATRELATVALLAVWNSPRQLHSHLRGALNAGASGDEVSAAVEIASRYLDLPEKAAVEELWAKVRSGSAGGAGSSRV